MLLAVNILYGVFGILFLYYGAEFLVKGGSSIAKKAGISPLVIGLTLVAFATSAPELVVSIRAALSGNADISLGNVVGSNICNIGLILGLCACITPLAVQRQLLKWDMPVLLISSILLAGFYYFSGGLERWQAAVLFSGFLFYTFWNVLSSKKEEKQNGNEEKKDRKKEKEKNIFFSLFLVFAGLLLLVAGAEIFLKSAIYFAGLFHLSDAVIALTIVAVGTSLPELATSIVAACKKESDIAIGNVVGSNIFNILGILGIAPLISPLKNASLDPVDLGAMLFTSLLLLPMMRSSWKLSRMEGAFLLIAYCGYVFYLLSHHI